MFDVKIRSNSGEWSTVGNSATLDGAIATAKEILAETRLTEAYVVDRATGGVRWCT